MSDNSASRWQCFLFLIFGVAIRLLTAISIPGNPMETIGLGAMILASNAAEVFQNGAALRHEGSMDTPFFSMNKKTELGFGEAMRKKSQNDYTAEDSDEYRKKRRRRSIKRINVHNMEKSQVLALVAAAPDIRRAIVSIYRLERAPCRRQTTPSGGSGGNGDNGDGDGDGDVEGVERLRAIPQRRNAIQRQRTSTSTGNNQSQRRTSNSPANKFNSKSRRRRRQAEIEFEESTNFYGNNTQKQFSKQTKEFTDTLHNTFNAVVDSMAAFVQKLRKTFEGEDNQITKPST